MDLKWSGLRQKLPMVNRRIKREEQKQAEVPKCLPTQLSVKGSPDMEQMESVTRTIQDKIIESGKKAAAKPHLHSSHNRSGWVASMCAHNITMQWLASIIGDIKPWVGAE
ncbi:hypothetical protein JTB14_001900 [Gonioctena quinquepunctata]|nr:hypothetical protein JTB14_001900 [Gonioctena quinquepunctata]